MQVEMVKENDDGSAIFTFEMTPEETKSFVLLGIKTAMLAGIKDAESWAADNPAEDEDEIKVGLSD
jgi:hypothetical protein